MFLSNNSLTIRFLWYFLEATEFCLKSVGVDSYMHVQDRHVRQALRSHLHTDTHSLMHHPCEVLGWLSASACSGDRQHWGHAPHPASLETRTNRTSWACPHTAHREGQTCWKSHGAHAFSDLGAQLDRQHPLSPLPLSLSTHCSP